jgi:GABA(A) receptor-associated protein
MGLSLEEVLHRYPGRVPVVVSCKDHVQLKKHKFLVPGDKSVGEFMCIVRGYFTVDSTSAVFMIVDNMLPAQTMTMSQLYSNHKSPEGHLCIQLRKESTFG